MSLERLLQRPLVLVAHQDDEALGCGALLQRANDPALIFATDGAPRAEQWWNAYGSRQAYANERRNEALQAMEILAVQELEFLSDYAPEACVDQELFRNLDRAYHALQQLSIPLKPKIILTMAYEGGHPDHDSCSVLASVLGRELSLPVWEMPFYSRTREGELSLQSFSGANHNEIVLKPTEHELDCKREVFSAYVSQKLVIEKFNWREERFRPQPAYDYAQPAHAGKLNYELWQWPMTGAEVSAAFAEFLSRHELTAREQEA